MCELAGRRLHPVIITGLSWLAIVAQMALIGVSKITALFTALATHPTAAPTACGIGWLGGGVADWAVDPQQGDGGAAVSAVAPRASGAVSTLPPPARDE